MAYEQKDLQGSLFKNDKRTKDSQPNMTGSAKIDGVDYWVSGWTKGEGEKRFISLAFKKKDGTVVARPQSKKPADDLSDVPF